MQNRVSDESADELRRVIENVADNIAKNAVDLVSQTKPKRVTIMREDRTNSWLQKEKESNMDRFKVI